MHQHSALNSPKERNKLIVHKKSRDELLHQHTLNSHLRMELEGKDVVRVDVEVMRASFGRR